MSCRQEEQFQHGCGCKKWIVSRPKDQKLLQMVAVCPLPPLGGLLKHTLFEMPESFPAPSASFSETLLLLALRLVSVLISFTIWCLHAENLSNSHPFIRNKPLHPFWLLRVGYTCAYDCEHRPQRFEIYSLGWLLLSTLKAPASHRRLRVNFVCPIVRWSQHRHCVFIFSPL